MYFQTFVLSVSHQFFPCHSFHVTVCKVDLLNSVKPLYVVSFLPAGANPCACLPSDAQPNPTGHSADRRGADPNRSTHRAYPAPPKGRVWPGKGWIREEDQRVSRSSEWANTNTASLQNSRIHTFQTGVYSLSYCLVFHTASCWHIPVKFRI